MGKFLEDLRASRSEPVAIHQRFRLEYNGASDDVYAFFESLDDWRFYRSPIQQRAHPGAQIRVYYCGNKKGVWKAYSFAEIRGTLKNVICFVDKDLDDYCASALPNRDRLFVTEFYSIENYLCTRSGVEVFLDLVVGLSNDSPERTALLEKFEESLAAFQRTMLPVFAWSVASRLKGAKLIFSNVGPNLDGCFEMHDLQPQVKCDLVEHFRGKCCDDADMSANEHEIAHWVGVLGASEPKAWLRGKYELWFTLRFLNEVWEGLVGTLITDRRKIKKVFNLDQESVFSVLGDKVAQPARLLEFLEKGIAA